MANKIGTTFAHGTKTSIGATAVQLSATRSFTSQNGIKLKADTANTAPVYIGNSSAVTSSGSTKGYPLLAGQETTVPIAYPDLIYLISTGGSQTVDFIQA